MKPKLANKLRMRKGFTLVELLVAMALILFIMSIVSVCFSDATESFRIFRSRAELSEKLRFITQTLRADLRADHFENGRRLSDKDFWVQGPPKAGYFRVEQEIPPPNNSALNQNNASFIPLYATPPMAGGSDVTLTATPIHKHAFMFTSFLKPDDYRGFHSVSVSSSPSIASFRNDISNVSPADSRLENGQSFNSPHAEVAWFLGGTNAPSIDSVTPYEFASSGSSNRLLATDIVDSNGFPVVLYKLYRRVWPMVPSDVPANTSFTNPPSNVPGISSVDPRTVSGLKDYAGNPSPLSYQLNILGTQLSPSNDVPTRRAIGRFMGSNQLSDWKRRSFANDFGKGCDPDSVIADNVLSFSIEVWPEGGTGFVNDYSSAFGQPVFDTWCGRNADSSWGVNSDFASYTGNNKPKWRDSTDPSCVPMISFLANGLPKRLLAVRVTIRLYDLNTKSTWQATVIEYL